MSDIFEQDIEDSQEDLRALEDENVETTSSEKYVFPDNLYKLNAEELKERANLFEINI